jgi:hypothetical protein
MMMSRHATPPPNRFNQGFYCCAKATNFAETNDKFSHASEGENALDRDAVIKDTSLFPPNVTV